MQSNFRRFRRLCRLAQVLVGIGLLSFILIMTLVKGMLAMPIGLTIWVVFGLVAGIISYVAYDCLICPKCGNRITIMLRNSFDKENCKRHRQIMHGEDVVCVTCGAKISTR